MAASKQIEIALTGGGTAGHVMPHLALLPHFAALGWRLYYIGGAGIEKELAGQAGIDYYEVQAGKLRRYFSWQNGIDLFKVGIGFLQALAILLRRRPQLVFSKGGFVSVPVAYAAWLLRIPVVTHESDLTPGLATKLICKVATKVLYAFPETAALLPRNKAIGTGLPIRAELATGDAAVGRSLCRFGTSKPVLLVMGGSLGAQRLNASLQAALPRLLLTYQVVHLTGKGKDGGFTADGYKAFEYVGADMKHLFAMATIVVTRAGANTIFELLALHKPMLLVPLELGSRGDQLHNAQCFAAKDWAGLLREQDLSSDTLEAALKLLAAHAPTMIAAQAKAQAAEARSQVMAVLKAVLT